MEVVSEGSLESISRPSSSGKRSCSRSSIRSSSLPVQGSLEILLPEEPLSVVGLELGENVVISNDDIDENVVVTDIDENDQNFCSKVENYLQIINTSDEKHSTKPREDVEIIEEVEGNNSESEAPSVNGSQYFDNIDPKIQKGLEKIKKLDSILAERVKKEREVKKQRLQQERLWRDKIENLEHSRDLEQLGKQIELGPAHMLALGAPEDTDDSLYEESPRQSPPVTPLFATQPIVNESNYEDNVHVNSQSSSKTSSNEQPREADDKSEKNETNEKRKNKKNKKTGKKDYIKRNIQLAADANNTIAMTEDEKKRLEKLLSDMGNLMDETSDKDLASWSCYGEGYRPTAEEIKQLDDIDSKLQVLIPAEEFDVLCNSSLSSEHDILSQIRTPRSDATSGTLFEESQTFGELVLQETKEMRVMKERLFAIENELERFKNLDHDQGILSESLLRQLVDGSSRTTSEATTISDRVSSVATSVSCDFDDNTSCITESSITE